MVVQKDLSCFFHPTSLRCFVDPRKDLKGVDYYRPTANCQDG